MAASAAAERRGGARQRDDDSKKSASTSTGTKAQAAVARPELSISYAPILRAAASAGFDTAWKADHRRDTSRTCALTGRTAAWPPWHPFVRTRTPLLGHVKNLLLLCLVPLRMALGVATLVLLGLWLNVVTIGTDTSKPMFGWRRTVIRASNSLAARAMLFWFAYFWISERHVPTEEGSPAAAMQHPPPLLVCNHSGIMEVLYVAARYGCCFVAKSTLAKQPILGTIMRCMQCIFVDRATGKSHTGQRIIDRAQHPGQWPTLAVFPEGTTTTGKQLIRFRTGAFIAGVPVKPVVVRLSSWLFDPAYTCCKGLPYILQVCAQLANFMHVIHLPTYVPSAAERADPKLYAANVRLLMSTIGKLPMYDLEWADKLKFEPPKKRAKSMRRFLAHHGTPANAAAAQGLQRSAPQPPPSSSAMRTTALVATTLVAAAAAYAFWLPTGAAL